MGLGFPPSSPSFHYSFLPPSFLSSPSLSYVFPSLFLSSTHCAVLNFCARFLVHACRSLYTVSTYSGIIWLQGVCKFLGNVQLFSKIVLSQIVLPLAVREHLHQITSLPTSGNLTEKFCPLMGISGGCDMVLHSLFKYLISVIFIEHSMVIIAPMRVILKQDCSSMNVNLVEQHDSIDTC